MSITAIPDELYSQLSVIEELLFKEFSPPLTKNDSEEEEDEILIPNEENIFNLVGVQPIDSLMSLYAIQVPNQVFDIIHKSNMIPISGISPQDAIDILLDIENRHQWDPNLLEAKLIEEKSKYKKVIYLKYQTSSSIFTSRDYCIFQNAYKLQKDQWVVLQHSIEHPNCPKTSFSTCRGNLSSAFGISSISKKCFKISFLNQINFGGFMKWAPNYLQNFEIKIRFSALLGLKKYIEENLLIKHFTPVADKNIFLEKLKKNKKKEEKGENSKGEANKKEETKDEENRKEPSKGNSKRKRKTKTVSQITKKIIKREITEKDKNESLNYLLLIREKTDCLLSKKILPLDLFKIILKKSGLLDKIMWNHPKDLPVQYRKLLDDACTKLLQYASEKWDPVCEEDSVTVTKKSVGGSQRSKGETTFKGIPLNIILGITKDIERKKEFDSLFDYGKTLKKFGDDTMILHLAYKAIWPTTARDFCMISQTRYYEDKVIEMATSITTPLCPPLSTHVRAEVITGGTIYIPSKNQKNTKEEDTHISYITEIDLKGSLPKSIVNMIAQRDPLSLVQLRKVCEMDLRKGECGRSRLLKTEVDVEFWDIKDVEIEDDENEENTIDENEDNKIYENEENTIEKNESQDKKDNFDSNPSSSSQSLSNSLLVTSQISIVENYCQQNDLSPSQNSNNKSSILSPSSTFAKNYPQLLTSQISTTETKYDSLIQNAELSLKQATQDLGKNGWELMKKKDSVLIFRKINSSSEFHSFKGVGEVKVSAKKVQEKLWTLTQTGDYDPLFKSGTVIEEFDQHKRVLRLEYQAKRCLMTTMRDFVIISCWREENGIFYITGKSITHPKSPPQIDKGITRGEIKESGFVIIPKTPNSCFVHYVTQVDLGGIAPQIVNIISETQPLVVAGLRKAFEKKK